MYDDVMYKAVYKFPVSKALDRLRKRRKQIWTLESAIYLAATLEYLTAEVMELSGNCARDRRNSFILEEDIAICINNDIELKMIASPIVQRLMIDNADVIKKRADIAKNKGDTCPIEFLQFKHMSLESLESFVSDGGNLRIQDSKGRTYLHYILHSEEIDFDIVSFLVSQGLDAIKDNHGDTPLMYAVRHKESEVADDLTSLMIRKRTVPIPQSALIEALKYSKCTIETIEYLFSQVEGTIDPSIMSAIITSEYDLPAPFLTEKSPYFPDTHSLYESMLCDREDIQEMILQYVKQDEGRLKEMGMYRQLDLVEPMFAFGASSEVHTELLDIDPNLVNLTTENGQTLVHEALSNGNPIDSFLTYNSSLLTQVDNEGRPPLFDAIQGLGNKAFLEFLIEHTTLLNFRVRSLDGSNFMHEFLYHRSMDRDYISKIFDIVNTEMGTLSALLKEQDNYGRTPLMIEPLIAAVDQFPKDVIKSTVSIQDKYGRTALMYARNVESVEILLSLGADPNIQDENGDTALHVAFSDIVLKLLKKNGGNMDLPNKQGITPRFLSEENTKNTEIIQVEEEEEDENYSNLCEAVLYTKPMSDEVIKRLQRGEANNVDEYGRTALHDVVLVGNITEHELDVFLKYSADPNIQDIDGRSVIMEAVSSSDILTLELIQLIKLAKDINMKDKSGSSLLHEAYHNKEIIKHLVSKGININATDNQGETVLHKIVKSDSIDEDIVKYLLKKDINLNIQNVYGETVLHIMLKQKFTRVTKMLLDKKPDFSLLDCHGQSPLHIYIKNRNIPDTEEIKKMMQNGANLYCTDYEGKTILYALPEDLVNEAILQCTPFCATIFKGDSNIHILLDGKFIPIHVGLIKQRAPLFFEQLSIQGNVARLKTELEPSAVTSLIDYLYTDTTSHLTDSLKQLAELFQLPRLVAIHGVLTNVSSVDLQKQYPSTLVNDAKAVYMHCNPSSTNEQVIELVCSEQTHIFVYKVVLVSTDYFRGMLQSGMQESHSSTIHLPEISAKSIQFVLEYLLSGTLTCEDGNELVELCIAANQLCIQSLATLCQILLVNQIDENNVQILSEFSQKYDAAMLLASCKEFSKQCKIKPPILENPELVWPEPDFIEMVKRELPSKEYEVTPEAIFELQKAAEDYVTRFFSCAKEFAKMNKRKFVTVQDIQLGKVKKFEDSQQAIIESQEEDSDVEME